MTRTTHGHHVPGTPTDDEVLPVAVARCGGPSVCRRCSREAQRLLHPESIVVTDDVTVTEEVTVTFDANALKRIAAEMRLKHAKPSGRMSTENRIAAEVTYSFIESIEKVAADMERESISASTTSLPISSD